MMTIRAALSFAVLALFAVGVSSVAALDHPDLPDFSGGGTGIGGAGPSVYSVAGGAVLVSDGAGVISAGGYQRLVKGVSSSGTVTWEIFEPDKIARSSKKAAMKQSAYVYLSVIGETTGGQSFLGSGIAEGCKAQLKVKDSDGDGTLDSGIADNYAWKVSCKSNALSDLGNNILDPAELVAFEKIFGTTKVSIKNSLQ